MVQPRNLHVYTKKSQDKLNSLNQIKPFEKVSEEPKSTETVNWVHISKFIESGLKLELVLSVLLPGSCLF